MSFQPLHPGNNIIQYYRTIDAPGQSPDRELELQKALRAEMAKNVVTVDETEPRVDAALRLPVALLILTLLFSAFSLGFALKDYNVKMEALFFQPTTLFNTEGLLIEALKKRSDLEISKRDRMIAEYERRAKLREEALVVLAPKEEAPAQVKPTTAVETQTASLAEELESLRREAALDALYARRLEQGLDQMSRRLLVSDLIGADQALKDLQKSLGPKSAAASDMAKASFGISAALSSSIAVMKATAEDLAAPKTVYVTDPGQEAAIKRLQAENVALLDRVVVLEARKAPAPVATPSPVSGPSGTFLGTVAVASGGRILVDLAQGARPNIGDRAEIYRSDAGGASVRLGEAVVSALREGTAELRIGEGGSTLPLRVRDTVFLVF
jgi:hypothetical protein